MTTTLIDTFLRTLLGDDDAFRIADGHFESQALAFLVGPRTGRTGSLEPGPRPLRDKASSSLSQMPSLREVQTMDNEASEEGFKHVRRMLSRTRTTQQSEAWGASPIETYMEGRVRGND